MSDTLQDIIDELTVKTTVTLSGIPPHAKNAMRIAVATKFSRAKKLMDSVGYLPDEWADASLVSHYDKDAFQMTFSLQPKKAKLEFTILKAEDATVPSDLEQDQKPGQ